MTHPVPTHQQTHDRASRAHPEALTPAQIEVQRRLGVLMDPLQASRHLAQAQHLKDAR